MHSGYRDLPSCWSQTEYLTQASNRGPVVDDESRLLPRGELRLCRATMDWEDGGVRENVQNCIIGDFVKSLTVINSNNNTFVDDCI